MANQALKAQFFVTRQNDRMVPLIALDELPDHIVLQSVPRNLTPRDIQGMVGVGNHDTRHKKHTIINLNQSPMTPLSGASLASIIPADFERERASPASNQSQSAEIDSNPENADTNSQDMKKQTHAPCITQLAPHGPALILPSLGQTPSMFDASGSNPFVNLPGPSPGLLLPQPGVKLYCSFWLRTGNCDYLQQGCRYKHEMPMDREVLNRLGHRDLPNWFREKYGYGSFLAVDGAGASFNKPGFKSVIASGSRAESARLSTNWRSPAGDTSDSGSDTRSYAARLKTPRSGRSGNGSSPLNPSKRAPNKKAPELKNGMMLRSHEAAGPVEVPNETVSSTAQGNNPAQASSDLAVPLVSLIDFEGDVFEEDADRKGKEEAEKAAADGNSSQETKAGVTGASLEEKGAEKKMPDKVSNLGTAGSVSGAKARPRGSRGGNGAKRNGQKGAAAGVKE